MSTFILMFKNVFIFVALTIPGFILAKSKMVTQDKTVSISKTITYVGVPFLILDNTISMSFQGDALTIILLAGILSLVITTVAFFATSPITKGFDDIKKRGVARFAMFSSNNGFLGIPLARVMFGVSDILSVVVISISLDASISIHLYLLCLRLNQENTEIHIESVYEKWKNCKQTLYCRNC